MIQRYLNAPVLFLTGSEVDRIPPLTRGVVVHMGRDLADFDFVTVYVPSLNRHFTVDLSCLKDPTLFQIGIPESGP